MRGSGGNEQVEEPEMSSPGDERTSVSTQHQQLALVAIHTSASCRRKLCSELLSEEL